LVRLLVATDFSVRSDRALRRASLLAHKLGASLTVVHVLDVDRPQKLIAADRFAASAALEELTGTLRDIDRLDADWLVRTDDIHAGILAAAEDVRADLIVVGPHRRRLSDVFVGTTAERMVRRSTRPLLVAVEDPSAHHRGTLLALDFDEASQVAARQALALGVFDHTDVVVMHAFDAPAEHLMKRSLEPVVSIQSYVEEERKRAARKLESLLTKLELPPSCRSIVSIKGSPARTILETAQQLDSDLIVLGTNQRNGFERVLVGSVAGDVIRDAHRDILIVPVEAAE
jgi:nucleotide-binding universal stress UspA family protein